MTCRRVSQPEDCCCCSSWWAYRSGFYSPLHTSTFFLLLHLSLSFSCRWVLSHVGRRGLDSGGGGFPQSYRRFFHSHDWPIALVIISRAVWVHNNDLLLACTKVPFTYFGAQSGSSSKRLVSSP